MFKVSKPEMVNKTFRMPVELIVKLNVVAQTQKVSLNNLVCQCCEYALDNLSESKEYKGFKGENTLYRLNNLVLRAFRGIKNDTIDGYTVSIYGI